MGESSAGARASDPCARAARAPLDIALMCEHFDVLMVLTEAHGLTASSRSTCSSNIGLVRNNGSGGRASATEAQGVGIKRLLKRFRARARCEPDRTLPRTQSDIAEPKRCC